MPRWLRIVSCFVLVCLVAWSGSATAEVGVTDTEIKIGVISDLSGPTAIGGIGMADAITSYFNAVNDAGGIHGRKVTVIVEDCAYAPAKAVAAAKKLMAKDGVFAFVSPWGTAPSTALFPITEKDKIPLAPACSLSTTIYDPLKKYVFAAGTNYVDQSLFIVDYAVNELKMNKPKVAIFCQDDDWGRDHVKGLEMAREKYGLPPIAVQTYKYDAVEFKSQVINLMKEKPDLVIVASAIKSGGMFLQEAHKMKWKTTFIGSNTLGFLPMLKLAGPYGEGLLVVNIFAMPDEDVPGMKKLIAASEKYLGDKWMPAAAKIHPYYVYGWANAMIFAEGLKRAGKNLTRESLVTALEGLKDFDMEGIMGSVSYSAESHGSPGYARMTKGDVEKMRFVPLTEWKLVQH
ncbi:MAG: ABC transporter substrate-binding protein [Desulfomonilaceae bacterium]|nr:ABC transporter substrate-binding protein [Desulfomonilaceae bacterium]